MQLRYDEREFNAKVAPFSDADNPAMPEVYAAGVACASIHQHLHARKLTLPTTASGRKQTAALIQEPDVPGVPDTGRSEGPRRVESGLRLHARKRTLRMSGWGKGIPPVRAAYRRGGRAAMLHS